MKSNKSLLAVAAGALAALAIAGTASANWTDDAKVFGGLWAEGGTAVVAEYRPDGSFRVEGADGAEYFGCQWNRPCNSGEIVTGAPTGEDATLEGAGWEEEAVAFHALFGDNTTAIVQEYYEDGSFIIHDEFGNSYGGCRADAPCNASAPIPDGESPTELYLPLVAPGYMVSAIGPVIHPDACSPFEQCAIEERR